VLFCIVIGSLKMVELIILSVNVKGKCIVTALMSVVQFRRNLASGNCLLYLSFQYSQTESWAPSTRASMPLVIT